MFREKFHQFLDPKHELMRAARLILWEKIHQKLTCYYSTRGRRPTFIRLMVGMHILKHPYNVSNEQAVQYLHENNCWQAFCRSEEL